VSADRWSELRPAIAADAAALAALDDLANPSPWSESQFFDACTGGEDRDRERVMLSDSDLQVQGFVVFSLVLDEASIHNIAVHPALQGRGLGQLLLNTALAQSRAAGARRCLLELRASNDAACCLYQKLGFQLDGSRRNYYPTAVGREDALLMSRPLYEQE
jgi:ribosomal-protein-alanine N-acetyltransferase